MNCVDLRVKLFSYRQCSPARVTVDSVFAFSLYTSTLGRENLVFWELGCENTFSLLCCDRQAVPWGSSSDTSNQHFLFRQINNGLFYMQIMIEKCLTNQIAQIPGLSTLDGFAKLKTQFWRAWFALLQHNMYSNVKGVFVHGHPMSIGHLHWKL